MSRSFEQYVSERLAEELQQSVDANLTPNKVSAILSDTDDSKKHLILAQLTIDCIYEKKLDAADASDKIAKAIAAIRRDNFVSKVTIVTTQADRKGLLGKWQYRTVADFLIKAGHQW